MAYHCWPWYHAKDGMMLLSNVHSVMLSVSH